MTVWVANGLGHPTAASSAAARLFAVACVFGAFLSAAGALDTEAAPTPARLTYWVALSATSACALELAHRFLTRRLRTVGPVKIRILGLALLALPLTLLAVMSCKLLFGGRPSMGGFVLLLPGMVAILAALQLCLGLFIRSGSIASLGPTASTEDHAHERRRLEKCLPLPLRSATIEALEAEDHYVRVHTNKGETLLRMRFRDALAMVTHLDGVHPHRSWWIATSCAASMARDGHRTFIMLKSGKRVPVTRRARADLGPGLR